VRAAIDGRYRVGERDVLECAVRDSRADHQRLLMRS
jgi:hypothetical protein